MGWARNESETLRTNLVTGARESRSKTENNFAYSLQAGVRVAISESWVGEAGYRFIDMGEIDSGRFTTGDKITADHYFSHDMVFGLIYMF